MRRVGLQRQGIARSVCLRQRRATREAGQRPRQLGLSDQGQRHQLRRRQGACPRISPHAARKGALSRGHLPPRAGRGPAGDALHRQLAGRSPRRRAHRRVAVLTEPLGRARPRRRRPSRGTKPDRARRRRASESRRPPPVAPRGGRRAHRLRRIQRRRPNGSDPGGRRAANRRVRLHVGRRGHRERVHEARVEGGSGRGASAARGHRRGELHRPGEPVRALLPGRP